MATGQYTQFPIDWKSLDASQVPYSNATSGLSATDVQNAIDELNTNLNAIDASDVPYDNTASGLTADDVQEALDELASEKQDALTAGDGITISSDTISTDNDATLTSAVKPAQAKAVGDALASIGETLKADFAPVITDTASGSIASFPDGADGYPLKECVVDVDAVQDLHGYDNPWPAGGGKNLLEITATTQTINGVTFTINKDSAGNVESVTANGTASATIYFRLKSYFKLPVGEYICTGCPSGGGNPYWIATYADGTTWKGNDTGSGRTFTVNTDYTPVNNDRVEIGIASGVTVNNLVFKPMIRLSSVSDATFTPYSNICPITGFSEAKVTRTGKNLYENTVASTTSNGITYTINSDGTILVTGRASANSYFNMSNMVLPAGTYTFNGCPSGGSNSTYKMSIYDVTTDTSNPGSNGDDGSGANVTANGIDSWRLFIRINNGYECPTGGLLFKPMIRKSTETDATYEPYNGQTYTISLGDTRYGAVLDVTRGKLRVTHVKLDMGDVSAHTWAKQNQGSSYYFIKTVPGIKRPSDGTSLPDAICSCYAPLGAAAVAQGSVGSEYHFGVGVSSDSLMVRDTSYSTADDFTAGVTGQTVVYALATPIEVDLTPTEITTLLGMNNLWSDTGDVEVEYCCSTKLFIEKKFAELA